MNCRFFPAMSKQTTLNLAYKSADNTSPPSFFINGTYYTPSCFHSAYFSDPHKYRLYPVDKTLSQCPGCTPSQLSELKAYIGLHTFLRNQNGEIFICGPLYFHIKLCKNLVYNKTHDVVQVLNYSEVSLKKLAGTKHPYRLIISSNKIRKYAKVWPGWATGIRGSH